MSDPRSLPAASAAMTASPLPPSPSPSPSPTATLPPTRGAPTSRAARAGRPADEGVAPSANSDEQQSPASSATAPASDTTIPDCPAPAFDTPAPVNADADIDAQNTAVPCGTRSEVTSSAATDDDRGPVIGWIWPGAGLITPWAFGVMAGGLRGTRDDAPFAPAHAIGPGRPTDPATPGEPASPANPSDPGGSGNSGGSGDSGSSGNSGSSGSSGDSGDSGSSGNSGNAGNSADPAGPTDPARPTDPTDPTNPSQPGDPSHPEDPSQPGNPTRPGDTGHPEDPSRPAEPPLPEDPTRPEGPSEPAQPGGDPTPPVDPFEPDPALRPGPVRLALAQDSGMSAVDHRTRDAQVIVTGLAPEANWQFSLDLGQTWHDGQGNSVDAALFTRDGLHTVLARQANAHGSSGLSALRLALYTHANDLDLSSQPGPQSALHRIVDRATIAAGVALTATDAALTPQDLHELRLRLGGDGFDPLNDRLRLDRDLDLSRDGQAQGVRIGGLDGLAYRYDAATASLAIWRADGSALTGSDAAALTNAIRLNNLQTRPRDGERTVTLSLLDVAGNVSADAQVSVMVDTRVPTLDFNGARPGLDADIAFRTLTAPRALLPDGAGLRHANPDARFQQVTIDAGGAGASRDDVLGSRDGGAVTALDQAANTFTVAGTAWHASRAADRFVFRLEDGSWASAAQTQALLESLTLGSVASQPQEGPRQFKVTVTDHLGRTGSATSVLLLDTTPPVLDLNGAAPGLDASLTAVSGVPIGVTLGLPTRSQVTESSGVVQLQFKFTSAVAGALAPTNNYPPNLRGDTEIFGFYDLDKPDQLLFMDNLGQPFSHSAVGWFPGLLMDMVYTRPGDGTVVVTIMPNMTLTENVTQTLLERLAYKCGIGQVPGVRQVEITATDRAGNVSIVPTLATLDVKPIGTPVVQLGRGSDTGASAHDELTFANGSAASPLTLAGFAAAAATVTLFRDADDNDLLEAGEALGTVVADSTGRWQYTLAGAALADGTHRFGAVASGFTSALLAVTVDASAPDSVIDIGSTVRPRPVLGGKTEANVSVTVELDTDGNLDNGYEVRYLTRADADGRWQLDTATATPVAGAARRFDGGDTVHLRVLATDRAGNVTTRTASAVAADTVYSLSDGQLVDGADGTTQLVFTVTRSGDLGEAGSVRFAVDRASTTASQSADELAGGIDFSGPSAGLLSFAAGETVKTIRFTVQGERGVIEEVGIRLEAPVHGRIDDGLGIGSLPVVDLDRLQGVEARVLRGVTSRVQAELLIDGPDDGGIGDDGRTIAPAALWASDPLHLVIAGQAVV